MYIYIMRHGETYWNKDGKIQGSSDIELTDFGVELAKLSADGFLRDGICFDRIYTSPLTRAIRTAEIIAEKNLKKDKGTAEAVEDDIQKQSEFRIDPRIREMCFGKYEGLKLKELRNHDENIVNCFSHPALYIADETGETYDEVYARIDDFMERELLPLERNPEMKNVLVLCHGTVIRAFLSRINGIDLEGFWKIRQPNCCINKIELRDGMFTSVQENILYYESEELMHRGIL
ncbi:MAG: histidine phosphatase family protein [Clostridiales bacterium]|nr:histidine phosphatase family protein [Clostridiales bacterium]